MSFISNLFEIAGDNSRSPQTKEELRTWLEEYCRGWRNHGEPNTWDVTSVTDMSELFEFLGTFNAPLDQWDTSQVTDMRGMFSNASSFNQPITFDTSQVTDMQDMFREATAFNQPLTFDTSQVTEMEGMFYEASSFNQPLTFNTSQGTNMDYMFDDATAMTFPRPRVDDSSSEEEAEPCEDNHRQLCCVCVVRCVDTVCLPCGHLCMCWHCATRVLNLSTKCPICRKQIESVKKVYYAGVEQVEE